MLKFTANYTNTNRNFVIQNLKGKRMKNKYTPSICVLQNILTRGAPTLLSKYLSEQLASDQNELCKQTRHGLISTHIPFWDGTIKGDDEKNNYPARTFFNEIFSKYLPEYDFVRGLIQPEALISDIVPTNNDNFRNQQVDFYIPQAYLVIEIDGKQHIKEEQKRLDNQRDNYLSLLGIKTIRINTKDIHNETDGLSKKMNEIKKRFDEPMFKSALEQYKNNFVEFEKIDEDVYKKQLLPTAIIRFQILLLKLIEYGYLDLKAPLWELTICNHDVENYEMIATHDVLSWLKNLCALQGLNFIKPKLQIKKISDVKKYSPKKGEMCVDMSVLRRWDDTNILHPNVIFIRTDYIETYPRRANNELRIESVNHFVLSHTNPIQYKIDISKHKKNLEFLLKNIFMYDEFRDGQIRIIENALNRKNTIGLLPTGSGKSLCYQICALLQPAASFVVCPLKALMVDQITDLHDPFYIHNVAYISSDLTAQEKEEIQNNYAMGKYFFIIISPERFQVKAFRDYFFQLSANISIAYAVIDEVHCLSEWGHDFRISYLNLADTISRYSKDHVFLGLTATASENVLKDVRLSLNIKNEDIIYPINFTRDELKFKVVDDKGEKNTIIVNELKQLNNTYNIFSSNEKRETGCGIIFTPYASQHAEIINSINTSLQLGRNNFVRNFNGQLPDEQKIRVQNDFKQNRFSLLVATKAFGMGINKTNVRFTIHYGIPVSVEALYQEAGRAGRDRINAFNYILLSKEIDHEQLKIVFNPSTTYEKIKEIQNDVYGRGQTRDVYTQLFLWINSNKSIPDEKKIIKIIFNLLDESEGDSINIPLTSLSNLIENEGIEVHRRRNEELDIGEEKAIYHLKLLGVISDWTKDFIGSYTIYKNTYTEKTFRNSLKEYIKKYDSYIDIENEYIDIFNSSESEINKCIRVLLTWSYDNFAYTRRESLKNVYELSCDCADGKITPQVFKRQIELYFKGGTIDENMLQQIAEGTVENFRSWFDILYQMKPQDLKVKLMRFLESNKDNVGLNCISGLVRLFLGDFGNLDGRQRLSHALTYVYNNKPLLFTDFLSHILEFVQTLKVSKQNEFIDLLFEYDLTDEQLQLTYTMLENERLLPSLLSIYNKQLIAINSTIYDKININ